MFLDAMAMTLHGSIFRYEPAMSYLASRGVTEEEIRLYKIGYSRIISVPREESPEYETFIKQTDKGRKFENKIIFPIFDVLGRVLGLFGRAIDSKEFKFFLTKEGKHIGALLGLHQALNYIYDTEKVFVVEGPFDLLSFRKVFPNTVSSITAGLYENQYRMLNMYAKTIVTVFDSDTAGREAAEKALNRWKNIVNVNLGYHDPNDCFRSMPFKRYKEYVQKRVSQVLLFT